MPFSMTIAVLPLLVVMVSAGGCGSRQSSDPPDPSAMLPPQPLALRSPAFDAGSRIPSRYTCDGEDLSPPLEWRHAPAGTRSFALIFDDPDARQVVGYTWVHWVLFNLPASADSLAEGVPPKTDLADGSRQGQNSWPRTGYGGPCPPRGEHRYIFRLYALDTALDLAASASAEELRQAMEGHVLAQAELMGRYRRP